MTQSKDNDIVFNIDTTEFESTITLDSTWEASEFTVTSPIDTMADTVTIDISSLTSDTADFDVSNITFEYIEFEDKMPDLSKVKSMVKHYPALAKAYENFKTVYKMVEQDYKGKVAAGEIDEYDDNIPF